MNTVKRILKPVLVQTRSTFSSKAGILGVEMYVPNKYVSQVDLEAYDEVGEGKYTIGLGQSKLSFVDDLEDTVSMMMSCVDNLLEKYEISQDQIGAIYVGTESAVDKSKSNKTFLMELFDTSFGQNTNIEGTDNINACYGGTQSLLDACYWVESHQDESKERFAVVVCGDVSEYDEPLARPTGGAGVVAMLVGRDATIQMNKDHKYSHFDHAYDFYKPNPSSPYPIVDGYFSNSCYLHAIDRCYTGGDFKESENDYLLFHAPYNKLIQKSVGFMKYLDYLNEDLIDEENLSFIEDEEVRNKIMEVSEEDRWLSTETPEIVNVFKKEFDEIYKNKTEPGTHLNREVGNTYSSALYFSLAGLVSEKGEDLENSDILMYSYGSGLASTIYQLNVRPEREEKFSLESMKKKLDVENRLNNRKRYSAEEYIEKFNVRQSIYTQMNNYETIGNVEELVDGTYYLESVDEHYRRKYKKKVSMEKVKKVRERRVAAYAN